jgi:phage N-6-adenine-methyltransferase
MPNLGNETSVAKTDIWLTPPHIIKALGEFDLDPCASVDRPWDTAKNHYTIEDDGYGRDWAGRVWMNPPYGPELDRWLHKLSNHGNGIALVFARTETRAFFRNVWASETARGIMFLRGRIRFHKPNGMLGGTSGAPSCLIAYGDDNLEALRNSELDGVVLEIGTKDELAYHWD